MFQRRKAKRLRNHFMFICCSLGGYRLIPTSTLCASIGRVLTNFLLNHQVRYKFSVRFVGVVVTLYEAALGPYAQARASRCTRTPSKEETTHAYDHLAMPAWIRFIRATAPPPLVFCTLDLSPTTNASVATAARQSPRPAYTRYTLHH